MMNATQSFRLFLIYKAFSIVEFLPVKKLSDKLVVVNTHFYFGGEGEIATLEKCVALTSSYSARKSKMTVLKSTIEDILQPLQFCFLIGLETLTKEGIRWNSHPTFFS